MHLNFFMGHCSINAQQPDRACRLRGLRRAGGGGTEHRAVCCVVVTLGLSVCAVVAHLLLKSARSGTEI